MDAKPKRRWFYPTSSWLVLLSLLVTALLFASERWRWFSFNERKGWTVLVAVTGVGVVLGLMSLWWLAALVFRLRFQFGIRTLLVLTVAVALPFSWLAVEKCRAVSQRRLATEISAAGFVVLYDSYFKPGKPTSLRTPADFVWLRNLLSDDFFTNVNSVFVRSRYFADIDLDRLQGVTKLWQLDLEGSTATDATLEHVGGLVQLGILNLKNTGVTDAGLPSLKGLTQLHTLCLAGTKVTDAGVRDLQQALPKCYIER